MDDIEIDAGNEDKCKNLDVIHKILMRKIDYA